MFRLLFINQKESDGEKKKPYLILYYKFFSLSVKQAANTGFAVLFSDQGLKMNVELGIIKQVLRKNELNDFLSLLYKE